MRRWGKYLGVLHKARRVSIKMLKKGTSQCFTTTCESLLLVAIYKMIQLPDSPNSLLYKEKRSVVGV
jgi:hypothetical protein